MGPMPSVEGGTLAQPLMLIPLPSRSHVRPALVRPAASGQSAQGHGLQVWAVGRAGGAGGVDALSCMSPQNGRSVSKRGVSCQFGPDVTKAFLEENKLDYIIRSHEVKAEGYEVAHGGRCVTVFSAPNYWCVPTSHPPGRSSQPTGFLFFFF